MVLCFYKKRIPQFRQKQWNNEFKGQLYVSYGKTNSFGVLNVFYGNINLVIRKKLNDENGRILILEVTIDDNEYLLIKILIQNVNKKQYQLETL